jgi:hypothetical protein
MAASSDLKEEAVDYSSSTKEASQYPLTSYQYNGLHSHSKKCWGTLLSTT